MMPAFDIEESMKQDEIVFKQRAFEHAKKLNVPKDLKYIVVHNLFKVPISKPRIIGLNYLLNWTNGFPEPVVIFTEKQFNNRYKYKGELLKLQRLCAVLKEANENI